MNTPTACQHCDGTNLEHDNGITWCLDCHRRTGPARFDLGTLIGLRMSHCGLLWSSSHDAAAAAHEGSHMGIHYNPKFVPITEKRLERLVELGLVRATESRDGRRYWSPTADIEAWFAARDNGVTYADYFAPWFSSPGTGRRITPTEFRRLVGATDDPEE